MNIQSEKLMETTFEILKKSYNIKRRQKHGKEGSRCNSMFGSVYKTRSGSVRRANH